MAAGTETAQQAGNELSDLKQRIAALEAQLAVLAECSACQPEDPCEVPLENALYGDFQLQGFWSSVSGNDATDVSDIGLYWGEIGWDLAQGPWSGHFSMMLDEEAVELYEAWGMYKQPESGAFAQFGRMLLPFADNDSYFPTYSAANDLGVMTARGIGAGIDDERYRVAAWLYKPELELLENGNPDAAGVPADLSEYCLWWDISRREATDCADGWQFSAGWLSQLATHNYGLVEGPVAGRVAALNLYGRYDWAGSGWHAIGEYVTALDEFDPLDLDANGDGRGDRPCALNLELAHTPDQQDTWAVGYQQTDEFLQHARNRYAVMYGRRLCELAELRLELSRGEYDEFAGDGRSSDTSFVAEYHLSF
ncbi:hypothetical protein KDL44_06720 [bacterium]|nr:hypothetical protein [bacterium]